MPQDVMYAYAAGPIFNPEQIAVMNVITTELGRGGFEVFNPYEASREIWKGRRPKDCTRAERRMVLEQNYQALDKSNLLVSWLNGRFDDGRPDTGVTWEMGYFFAQQMFNADDGMLHIGYLHPYEAMPKDLNLMLAGTLDALVTDITSLRHAVIEARDICDMPFADEHRDAVYSHEAKAAFQEKYDPERLDLSEKEVTGGQASHANDARDLKFPRPAVEKVRGEIRSLPRPDKFGSDLPGPENGIDGSTSIL